MARQSPHRRRQRAVLAGAAALVAVVVAVALLLDASQLTGPVSGTMGAAAAMEATDAAFAWDDAMIDRPSGTLQGMFEASVTVRSATPREGAAFDLYFSRDTRFDAGQDCRVQGRTQSLVPGEAADVSFRLLAYEAPCVDAGTWYVAIHVVDTDRWIVLDEAVVISGGSAEVELASVPSDRGWGEAIPVTLDIYRQAGDEGLAGLADHPVRVWLRRGDQTCVADAAPLTMPRDPARRIPGSWAATRAVITVQPAEARRVDSDAKLVDLASRTAADLRIAGPCRLEEGEWDLAVGPVSPDRVQVATIAVHAPPVWVDDRPVEVTLHVGEASPVEVPAYNPSRRAVTWSAAAEDLVAEDWLKDMRKQRLDGRDSTMLPLTVSAVGLQPGFYESAFVVKVGDYYGTEVRVPVRLTVEQGRRVAREDDPSLPGSFEISNYPNPFRGRTTIRVQLREPGTVRLAVYDLSGREVRTVVDEWMTEGLHEIPFEADGLPSGTYLARVVTDAGALTHTMTLVN